MSSKLYFTLSQAKMCEALEYYFNNIVYQPGKEIKITQGSTQNSYDEDFTVYMTELNIAMIEKGGE